MDGLRPSAESEERSIEPATQMNTSKEVLKETKIMPSIQTASKALLTAQYKELCVKLYSNSTDSLVAATCTTPGTCIGIQNSDLSFVPPRYPHGSAENAAGLQGPSMSVSQTERKRSFKVQDQFGSVVV